MSMKWAKRIDVEIVISCAKCLHTEAVFTTFLWKQKAVEIFIKEHNSFYAFHQHHMWIGISWILHQLDFTVKQCRISLMRNFFSLSRGLERKGGFKPKFSFAILYWFSVLNFYGSRFKLGLHRTMQIRYYFFKSTFYIGWVDINFVSKQN